MYFKEIGTDVGDEINLGQEGEGAGACSGE
jgi:hypothetical protein